MRLRASNASGGSWRPKVPSPRPLGVKVHGPNARQGAHMRLRAQGVWQGPPPPPECRHRKPWGSKAGRWVLSENLATARKTKHTDKSKTKCVFHNRT